MSRRSGRKTQIVSAQLEAEHAEGIKKLARSRRVTSSQVLRDIVAAYFESKPAESARVETRAEVIEIVRAEFERLQGNGEDGIRTLLLASRSLCAASRGPHPRPSAQVARGLLKAA